jgi:hypothetical protein
MGGIPKSILVAVAAILGLCAVAGFGLGLSSTFAHRVAAADDEEAPIAGNIPAGAVIKDAQPLAAPPPPPPPVVKPKAAPVADAASDQPPSDALAAKPPAAPPTESAPGAPPSLAVPPPPKPAQLPTDLPPT